MNLSRWLILFWSDYLLLFLLQALLSKQTGWWSQWKQLITARYQSMLLFLWFQNQPQLFNGSCSCFVHQINLISAWIFQLQESVVAVSCYSKAINAQTSEKWPEPTFVSFPAISLRFWAPWALGRCETLSRLTHVARDNWLSQVFF